MVDHWARLSGTWSVDRKVVRTVARKGEKSESNLVVPRVDQSVA